MELLLGGRQWQTSSTSLLFATLHGQGCHELVAICQHTHLASLIPITIRKASTALAFLKLRKQNYSRGLYCNVMLQKGAFLMGEKIVAYSTVFLLITVSMLRICSFYLN